MLGNSLTTANGLPSLLADRLEADVVVHARCGARLAEHLNPETRLGALTQRAFAEGGWDFVVLQESSNGPVVHRARFIEAASRLCSQIIGANGTPEFFATWAYGPNCRKLDKMGVTRDEMHERLSSVYREAAKTGEALLADVGQAFNDHAHAETLFRADGVHPSAEGTELAASVLARCLAPGKATSTTANDTAPYTVYILRCEDGSLYTGITTDVERRFQEHASRGPKAARYTRTHPVVGIEATFGASDRAAASALEYRIKKLSHAEKLELIASTCAGSGFATFPPNDGQTPPIAPSPR